MSWRVLRERITARELAGIGLLAVGLVLLSCSSSGASRGRPRRDEHLVLGRAAVHADLDVPALAGYVVPHGVTLPS